MLVDYENENESEHEVEVDNHPRSLFSLSSLVLPFHAYELLLPLSILLFQSCIFLVQQPHVQCVELVLLGMLSSTFLLALEIPLCFACLD